METKLRSRGGDMSPPTGLEILCDWHFYKDDAPDGASERPRCIFTQRLKPRCYSKTEIAPCHANPPPSPALPPASDFRYGARPERNS